MTHNSTRYFWLWALAFFNQLKLQEYITFQGSRFLKIFFLWGLSWSMQYWWDLLVLFSFLDANHGFFKFGNRMQDITHICHCVAYKEDGHVPVITWFHCWSVLLQLKHITLITTWLWTYFCLATNVIIVLYFFLIDVLRNIMIVFSWLLHLCKD